MSSPELFISRACAKRYRARGRPARWEAREATRQRPARGRQDEEKDVGETRRRDEGWREDGGPSGEAKTRNETADCR